MTTITVLKDFSTKDNLVAIPRQEYEDFLMLKKVLAITGPTKSDLLALKRGRQEIKYGQYIEWAQVKN